MDIKKTWKRVVAASLAVLVVAGTVTVNTGKIDLFGGTSITASAAALQGDGSETTPYLIASAADWDILAEEVKNGESYAGKYFKLTADISVSTMVGRNNHDTSVAFAPFSGTFDGDGHTLTVSIDSTSTHGAAPFCGVQNAVIKNLRVEGSVNGGIHSSGLVGVTGKTDSETLVIENVVVNANVSGSTHHGGIVGHGFASKITLNSVTFGGRVAASSFSGGLIGWCDTGSPTLTANHCSFTGTYANNFHPVGFACSNIGTAAVTDFYTTSPANNTNQNQYKYSDDSEINNISITAPAAKTGLLSVGNEVELVEPGTTDAGVMKYSLDGKTYSEEVPAAAYGEHTVWYRVELDSNYNIGDNKLTVNVIKDEHNVVIADSEHGKVTVNKSPAFTGEDMTLTVTPDAHYELDSFSCIKANDLDQRIALSALAGDRTDHEGFDKLVDGQTGTKWGVNYSGSAYVIVKADALTAMKRYTLTTANDNESYRGRNWKDWTIYGANFDSDSDAVREAAEWEEITSVADDNKLEDRNFTSYDYELTSAAKPYRYYKIEVTASKGAGFIQMSEFTMYGDNYSEFTPENDSTNTAEYKFEMPGSDVLVDATFKRSDHSFKYTAKGATLTAKCMDDCDITEGLTMTISASDATYDGEAHGAELSTDYNTTAFPGKYTIKYYKGDTKLDGAPVDAGSYTAKVTAGKATASVDFEIKKASVTVTADAKSKTYGKKDPKLTYTATELLDGNTFSGKLSRKKGEDAGTYNITLGTLSAGDNYEITFVGADFTIDKASITITADDHSTKHREDIAELTYQIGGEYVEGDDLGVALSTDATSSSNVGEYGITVKWNGNANYIAELTNGKYTITKADLTTSAAGYDGSYDGKAHSISVDIGDSDAVVYYGTEELTADNYDTAGSTTAPQYTDVGEYTVYYYIVTDNYDPQPVSGSKTVNIAKAEVTVTANNVSKIYGEDDPELTYTAEGLVGEDTLSGALTREEGENAGTYAITYGTLTADDNYVIAFSNGAFTIDPAPISIIAIDKSSQYHSDIVELTYDVGGVYIEGDELGVTLSTDATNESDIGEYEITVSWNENPNYEATLINGKYTITASPLEVSASGYDAVYDGEAHGITVDIGESDAVVYYGTEELTAENYETVGSTTAPTYTDAGEYTVYYYVAANNAEGDAVSGSKAVIIRKADAIVKTAPKAAELTANGKAQALVTAGETEDGKLIYAVSADKGNAPADDAYSEAIPSAKDAGTYYVWYKVSGDINHNDSKAAFVEVNVKAAQTDDSSKPDDSKPDSSKPDESKTDSSKTDESKTDSSKADSSKTENPSAAGTKTASSNPATGVAAGLGVLTLAGAAIIASKKKK